MHIAHHDRRPRPHRLRRAVTAAFSSIALLFSPGCAQSQARPAESAPVTDKGPALWKVSDHDTTIYLLGTVHALPDDVDWKRGKIGPALDSADTLVTEVDLNAENTAEVQKIVVEKGVLPAGQTLRGLLTDTQRAQYEKAIADLGMPANAFDRFEPWYATLLFTMLPLAKQGIASANGVEKTLSTQIRPDVKREALETVDYQLSLFDSLPQAAQVEFLMKTIEGQGDVAAQLKAMIADWLAGDADGLAKLMNEDINDPQLLDRLLYERNRNWAAWVKKRLDTPGTVFVAVGAGHLAGKRSVQDDLAQLGVKVERVQ